MKRFLPAIVLVLSVLWVGASFIPSKSAQGNVDLVTFGKIPVLVGGRVKPMDTVARNSLLIIHSKSTLEVADGKTLSAIEWLSDLCFKPEVADSYPLFVIRNPDVLGLFGWEQSDRKYFSFNELAPFLKQIDAQGEQAEKLESVQRSAYQTEVLNLRNALILGQRLKNSLRPEGAHDFSKELAAYTVAIPAAAEALRQREKGENFDKAKLEAISSFAERYDTLANMAYMLTLPGTDGAQWKTIGASLVEGLTTAEIHPVVAAYATLGDAYQNGDAAVFNERAAFLRDWFAKEQGASVKRASYEFFFNHADPFTHSMYLYVLALLLACFSWLVWNRTLNRTAFYLLLVAPGGPTPRLVSRLYLYAGPP